MAKQALSLIFSGNDSILFEGDANNYALLHDILSRKDFTSIVAADGKHGLEMAHKLRPAVITLDIMMPRKDGWQLLAALKPDPVMQDIPVVLFTLGEDRSRGLALGVSRYLIQPMERQHLLSLLRTCQCSESSVVDDDPVQRDILFRTLVAAGYEVAETENGLEALAYLESNEVSLVFLGLVMPAMDGLKLLQVLHSHDHWKRFLVVVVTAKEWTVEERTQLTDSVNRIMQQGSSERWRLLHDIDDLIAVQLPGQNAGIPMVGVHA